jgi:ubiquinone biosynthesis protein
VAVKVKRPGIAMKLFTDLKTISWLCQWAEALGFVRTGITRNFRIELSRMLSEELNFRLEARYTEIFGRISERHKFISAPKVYPHLSDNEVLVTEFISGVFLNEILNALERNDPDDIQRLMARGFSPKKISKRMMNIFHWEIFESLFFHADPHPANIIVRTDNTIVMIDFGSCGSISNRIKRKLLTFNRLMAAEDLQGMVQNTIAMLEPLPHFDVDSFSVDLLNIYRAREEIRRAHDARHRADFSGQLHVRFHHLPAEPPSRPDQGVHEMVRFLEQEESPPHGGIAGGPDLWPT